MVVAPSLSDPRSVTILGATGSVGRSTLDLISQARASYDIEALTAWRNVDELAACARRHRPRLAVIGDPDRYGDLEAALAGTGIEVAAGADALVEAARRPADWVMAAIVGAAGLAPTIAAVRRGAMVALANKECLVCAGRLFMREASRSNATILPVDSEHNAIFQALSGRDCRDVERLTLTASGGPFRQSTQDSMARATPAQAANHPNWRMGPKISIDSATMMNKGLEVIEAHHLFAVTPDQVDVLIHPESVIHSMVSFGDGSVLAQLGVADMRVPISYTLGWPKRLETKSPRLDLARIGRLTFEQPDDARFPALRLAREALRRGGAAPTILNAANEVAVAAFLQERLPFLDIVAIVETTLEIVDDVELEDLGHVAAVDADARRIASQLVARRSTQNRMLS